MDRVSKIRLKGGFYTEQFDIALRENDRQRVSVIYGNNGCGKSSLSNAIDEYKNSETGIFESFESISLLDKDSNIVELKQEEKKNIWVYSQRYIENNINWEEDNLGAIVMLGELAEIEDQLKMTNDKVVNISKDIEKIDIHKYESSKGEHSVSYSYNSILNQLKASWAFREKNIRELQKNAPVSETTLNEILTVKKSVTTVAELKNDFERRFDEYVKVRGNSEKYVFFQIPQFDSSHDIDINSLLRKKIDKPKGTVLENKLYELIDDGQRSFVGSALNHFSVEHNSECPYCMQTVSIKHKEQLLSAIRNVLSFEVQNHITELEYLKGIIPKVNIDLDYLRSLDNDRVSILLKLISEFNMQVDNVRNYIDKKIENVFVPIDSFQIFLSDYYNKISMYSSELTNAIKSYNNKVENILGMKNDLLLLNKKIALLEITEQHKSYTLLTEKRARDSESHESLIKELDIQKRKAFDLNAKKQKVDIALNDINKYLYRIFSDKNRLRLELDERSNYRITSRGKRIQLKKLSAGERSVISLCYFFAQIKGNTSAKKRFLEPYFIVLDDPISSLDFDNKIGIYSFLRSEFEQIIKNNRKSRMVIFTHDLEVVFKLNKVLNDTIESLNLKNIIGYRKFGFDKNTYDIQPGKINSYGWNIELIYRYANNEPEVMDSVDNQIGNILRKTFEAYSTFNFKMGFVEITQDENILNKIQDVELREHFKTRMFRLVLHSESHTEEQAKSFDEYEIFEQFSRAEKVQAAKDILSVLYLLDSEHIKAYLLYDNQKISNISGWISDCKFDI